MVFAPGPLLTVTIEQHGDDVDLHVHPGGQGVWQARMAALLGAPVVLCTALGGEVGGVISDALAEEMFEVRSVKRGTTRGSSAPLSTVTADRRPSASARV